MSKIYRYIVAGVITAVVLFLVWYFSNVVAYILTAAVLALLIVINVRQSRDEKRREAARRKGAMQP